MSDVQPFHKLGNGYVNIRNIAELNVWELPPYGDSNKPRTQYACKLTTGDEITLNKLDYEELCKVVQDPAKVLRARDFFKLNDSNTIHLDSVSRLLFIPARGHGEYWHPEEYICHLKNGDKISLDKPDYDRLMNVLNGRAETD